MSPHAALRELAARGIRVVLQGDKVTLRATAGGGLTPELVERLRGKKAEIFEAARNFPKCPECGAAIFPDEPETWWGLDRVHLDCGKAAWRREWHGDAGAAGPPDMTPRPQRAQPIATFTGRKGEMTMTTTLQENCGYDADDLANNLEVLGGEHTEEQRAYLRDIAKRLKLFATYRDDEGVTLRSTYQDRTEGRYHCKVPSQMKIKQT
jgi:hypothetical protein